MNSYYNLSVSDIIELAEFSCLVINAVQAVFKTFYVLVVFLLNEFVICY